MSVIKSFAVDNGDMFYIYHNSDSFTIIDCCIHQNRAIDILLEIDKLSSSKGITRFISTHPDEDHIKGITELNDWFDIPNFYCVENTTTKLDESDDFRTYCALMDSEKSFYISKGCTRRWLNRDNEERGSAGIKILWPDLNNTHFQEALRQAADGESPNNISAIIKYSLKEGATVLWMGDLETDFMESIESELALPKNVDILFAPHHGRDSGKIPESMLQAMNPKVIIIGEAPSQHLNYYGSYNTITQNSAGDIVFICRQEKVHIFTSERYNVDFLEDEGYKPTGVHYLGTLIL